MDDTTRLLARHFFRRFIENDLISPDADRHQTLAVVSACVISFGLVVTMLLAVKYLAALPTPGQVSLQSLDDKYLYMGWSMAVMALLTLAEWDALALDARDAAILGPLPITAATVFKAKAAALSAFAGGCLVVLNGVPTLIFSSALVSKLVVSGRAYATLIAVHAFTTMAAGAFGFFSILAIREVLHALLGSRMFNRISTILQAALVVCVVVSLCLLPALSNHIGRTRLTAQQMAHPLPPLWFVGLYEMGAGHVMDDLSRTLVPRRLLPFDRTSTQAYRSVQWAFRPLANIALIALLLTATAAIGAYTWNNRALPPPLSPQRDVPHRFRAWFVRFAEQCLVRTPLSRAGFFFALQTLGRSATHRLTMATAVAVGLAFTAIGAQHQDVLVIQPMVLLVLLTAFRHGARIPGELRGNWAFQLCWAGETSPFMTGVKRAALLCVILPALLLLLPLHIATFGLRVAVLHLLLGALMAAVVLEIAMLGFRTLPFASSYAGGENLKGWLPVFVIAFVPAAHVVASVERVALSDWRGAVILGGVLIGSFPALRVLERRQRQSYGPVDFYELPAHTQQLDLTA